MQNSTAAQVIELSLSTDYVPHWSVQHGLREMIQNAIDGENEPGGFSHFYDIETSCLELRNKNCALKRSVWLIGKTNKADDDSKLGQFGEGMKLGALALLRSQVKVEFLNGSEKWIPTLEESSLFEDGEMVLKINCIPAETQSDFVCRIFCSFDEWTQIQKDFLYFSEGREVIEKTRVYESGDKAGKVWVKGILVEADSGFTRGYNLVNAEINRDRTTISHSSMRNQILSVLYEHWLKRDQWSDSEVLAFLEAGDEDFKLMDWFSMNWDATKRLDAAWVAKYGENSFPVMNEAEVEQLKFFGKNPVVVNSSVYDIFKHSNKLAPARVVERLRTAEPKSFEANELQKSNLQFAIEILTEPAKSVDFLLDKDKIIVVEFDSKEIKGCADRKNNALMVNHLTLLTKKDAVKSLAHCICLICSVRPGVDKMDYGEALLSLLTAAVTDSRQTR